MSARNGWETNGRGTLTSSGNSVKIARMACSPPDQPRPLSPAEQNRRDAARHKRERILESAAFLFSKQGFAKTTVDEIARKASISKGLIYVHFPSKSDLLAAVLERAAQEWGEAIRAGSAHQARSLSERIANTHRASFHYAQSHPILRGILAQDPRLLLPRHKNIGASVVRQYREGLEQLLREGVHSGEVREDLDPHQTARSIALLHRVVVEDLFLQPGKRRAADEEDHLIEATVALIQNGIRR